MGRPTAGSLMPDRFLRSREADAGGTARLPVRGFFDLQETDTWCERRYL